MKKILISGSNGFIGSALKSSFSEEYDVFQLTTSQTGENCFNWDELNSVSEEFEFIIMAHAGVSSSSFTLSDEENYQINVVATDRLLNQFPNSKFIYLSTASIFDSSKIIKENSNFSPKNGYSISKYWGGVKSLDHNAKIICLSSVFGPNMKENTLIPLWVNQAIEKKEIKVLGTGQRKQNYIYVDNVVNFVKQCMKEFNSPRSYFLATDEKEYSNLEVARIISNYTGAEVIFEGEDTSPSFEYDNLLSREILKIESQFDFENDLIKYIEWKKKQS